MTDPSGQMLKPTRPRRPLLLRLLALLYLLLALFGALRLAGVLGSRELLAEYLSPTLLVYIAISGAVWAASGLASAGALWTGMPFASLLTRATALAWFAWYWLDRLWLTRSSSAGSADVFAGVASALLLAFAVITPALPEVKRYLDHHH